MATAINIQQRDEMTVRQVGKPVTIFKGPYNEYNFMVKNANGVISHNREIIPEDKKLLKVFPFGGGSGCGSCITVLFYYAVILVGIFMIVSSLFGWFDAQTIGIFIGVALFCTIFHCVGFVFMYINSSRFSGTIVFIEAGHGVQMQTTNTFFEFESTRSQTIQILSVDDTEGIYARLGNRVGVSIKVMIYTTDYSWSQIAVPRIKYFFLIALHIAALAISCNSYISLTTN